jgi:hypothetical protein
VAKPSDGPSAPSAAASEGSSTDDGLARAVVSLTRTARGRVFWAAWWSRSPSERPFVPADAQSGGARTREEALVEAEARAGRPLALVEGRFARAALRMQQGLPPELPPRARKEPTASSYHSVLGVAPGAPLADVKRAFRARALETHPDRGGDAEAFRAVREAYERAVARAGRRR